MMIFVFQSTRAVITAEKLCREARLPCRVLPVPRSVSPRCGMALEMEASLEKRARELFKGAGLVISAFDKDDVEL